MNIVQSYDNGTKLTHSDTKCPTHWDQLTNLRSLDFNKNDNGGIKCTSQMSNSWSELTNFTYFVKMYIWDELNNFMNFVKIYEMVTVVPMQSP